MEHIGKVLFQGDRSTPCQEVSKAFEDAKGDIVGQVGRRASNEFLRLRVEGGVLETVGKAMSLVLSSVRDQ